MGVTPVKGQDLNTAIQYFQSGNLLKAEAILRKILKKSPWNVEALRSLAMIAYRREDHDAAVKYLKKAIAQDPKDAATYNNLGFILKSKGLLDEAIDYFRKAINNKPFFSDALYNLGNALHMKGRLDDAIECYRETLHINPRDFEAWNNLGNVLKDKGSTEEALEAYEKALQFNPDFFLAYNNLGTVFQDQGQFEKARQSYQQSLTLNPRYIPAYNNMGLSYLEENRLQESMSWFKRVLALNPDDAEAHWNMAFAFLLAGNFGEGWQEYEWRFRKKNTTLIERKFSQPRWDGKDVKDSTMLLYAEQGMGDVIQFIRYVPLLTRKGATVIVECQQELASLIRNVEGVGEVIEKGRVLPPFDIWCPLLSLPQVFGTQSETIPADIPYLLVPQEKIRQWKEKVLSTPAALRVGLVWAGNPAHRNDRKRSIPVNLFRPLPAIKGIVLYSLQKKRVFQNKESPLVENSLIDYMDEVKDFSDTAAFIDSLDLVISADTAVAHLAGALGKKVWTLLPFAPDWRWMLNRAESPWYPTMRLFRQPKFGDWESVIDEISCKLRKEMSLEDCNP